jgi:hypothetical protein
VRQWLARVTVTLALGVPWIVQASCTSLAVPVAPQVSDAAVQDAGSMPDASPEADTLVTLLKPSAALELPVVSGSAFKAEVYVNPILGAPTKVSFSVGSVADRGYLAAESIGGNVWRMTQPIDTFTYQASLSDAQNDASLREQTLSDVCYDVRARVDLPDGTTRFSAYVRALSRNKVPEFVGIVPVWNPKKAWAASFADYSSFIRSYEKPKRRAPTILQAIPWAKSWVR